MPDIPGQAPWSPSSRRSPQAEPGIVLPFIWKENYRACSLAPSLLLRSCIFEHDHNRTLAFDGPCQAKCCQLLRRSAQGSKHRFFFIPILRSTRLFLCKNRLKISLTREPLAATKAALLSLLPASGSRVCLVHGDLPTWRSCPWVPQILPSSSQAWGGWDSGINRLTGWDKRGDSWKKNQKKQDA